MKEHLFKCQEQGRIDSALGLCCSQQHGEHFTGRGKNGFNSVPADSGRKHHTSVKKKLEMKRGQMLPQDLHKEHN